MCSTVICTVIGIVVSQTYGMKVTIVVINKGLSGSGLDLSERIDFLCLGIPFSSFRTHFIVSQKPLTDPD